MGIIINAIASILYFFSIGTLFILVPILGVALAKGA